jgi:myo-inositol 2-dehydrogenase/D-chiro-inositol 1-dehydrogenase
MERSSEMGIALIGAGRMGLFHGETVSRRLPGPRLVAVADPVGGGQELDADRLYTDVAQVWDDSEVDAVVIAAPARFHADLVVAAAQAGKSVFCEKPMALTLADADRAIAAARDAGVVLQVGFQRRFAPDWAAARALLDAGQIGTPRLLRSLTRDPGGFDPARVPPNTIFFETLIHDFDVLRFLNPGATAVEVYATADALIEADWRDRGLRDTAATTYGHDVRAEVFGSAGAATVGDARRTAMTFSGPAGRSIATMHSDQELFGGAYVAELAAFAEAVRTGTPAPVTGQDARAALAIALAAAESAESGKPVQVTA